MPHHLIAQLHERIRGNTEGDVASYIPELANVNPDLLAISFCDVNGKQTHIGDTSFDFCLQSCSKPLTYCLARMLQAREMEQQASSSSSSSSSSPQPQRVVDVHSHVGYEPSGRAFNDFALNRDGLPHNPLINAGAIMVASLVKPDHEPSDRFNTVLEFYRDMCGHAGRVGFDNGVFLSEKHHADRNLSLAYFMREKGAFVGTPTPSQLMDHLNLYFQCCSVTINARMGSIMAATLANQGTCPLSGQRVVQPDIVKDVLAIMYGCGMYDYSGQFGFEVGLPAKSGVSGCVLLVVPNVGGLCIWSPRLDRQGNSVRGLDCCRVFTELTKSRYHLFGWASSLPLPAPAVGDECHAEQPPAQSYRHTMHAPPTNKGDDQRTHCDGGDGDGDGGGNAEQQRDPNCTTTIPTTYQIIAAAAAGDTAVLRQVHDPKHLCSADYDGRTALHLACAEGQLEAVQLLVSRGASVDHKDRWGNTPTHEVHKYRNKGQSINSNSSSFTSTSGALADAMLKLLTSHDTAGKADGVA